MTCSSKSESFQMFLNDLSTTNTHKILKQQAPKHLIHKQTWNFHISLNSGVKTHSSSFKFQLIKLMTQESSLLAYKWLNPNSKEVAYLVNCNWIQAWPTLSGEWIQCKAIQQRPWFVNHHPTLKWDVPKISTPQLHIKWALIYGTTHYEGVTLLLPSIVDRGSTDK
jgi:hypothetical protein